MKTSTAIIVFVILSGIFWVWYDSVFAPKAELEKALADAAAGDMAQKIRAADMSMICDNFYRMDAKVLKRENWSQLRTYGFLARCSSKTVKDGVNLLEEAAMTGNPEATYRMALATVSAPDNSSFEWMKKAAEKNHKLAQQSLAFRYTKMKPPKYKEALFWFEVSGDNLSEAWRKDSYDTARNNLTDDEKVEIMKQVKEWLDSHAYSKN